MRNLLCILCLVLFTSCMTDKQIVKNKEHILDVLNIHSRVTYRDTTIYKDRVIEVKLPADTAKIDNVLKYNDLTKEIEILRYNAVTKEAEAIPSVSVKNGMAGATAWVDRKGLHVRAFLTAEVVPVTVHDTIQLKGAVKTITTEIPMDKPKNWYTKTALWVFTIELILVLLFVALKVIPIFFPQLKIIGTITKFLRI